MDSKEKLVDNTEYEFKILYAITIIIIVMGHCGAGEFYWFSTIFPCYSFAITPFIFSSGYFYKEKYESNVKEYIVNKFKRLVIPLYLWTFFYAIVTYIIQHFGYYTSDIINQKTLLVDPMTSGLQFSLFISSWFVFPLFLTYVINILARKITSYFGCRDKEYIFVVLALIAGCFATYLSNHQINTGIYCLVIKTFLFIPFFEFGILYRKYKQYDRLGNLPYFLIIIILALILINIYGGMPIIKPGEGHISETTTFLLMPYITGMLGTAFWLRISKILKPAIGKSKYVNLIANNTYPIMMNNICGMKVSYAIYALLHTYTNLCPDFDMSKYKSEVWYQYSLNHYDQIYILHVVFVIAFSILLQKCFTYLNNLIVSYYKKIKNQDN